MKIGNAASINPYLERAHKNEDALQKEHRDEQEESKSDEEQPEPVDPLRLSVEIEEFSSEPASQANGLKAELVEGQGPGLRVTLTDGSGSVIRQFTGEEFMQMRKAAAGTRRGGILDKKL